MTERFGANAGRIYSTPSLAEFVDVDVESVRRSPAGDWYFDDVCDLLSPDDREAAWRALPFRSRRQADPSGPDGCRCVDADGVRHLARLASVGKGQLDFDLLRAVADVVVGAAGDRPEVRRGPAPQPEVRREPAERPDVREIYGQLDVDMTLPAGRTVHVRGRPDWPLFRLCDVLAAFGSQDPDRMTRIYANKRAVQIYRFDGDVIRHPGGGRPKLTQSWYIDVVGLERLAGGPRKAPPGLLDWIMRVAVPHIDDHGTPPPPEAAPAT